MEKQKLIEEINRLKKEKKCRYYGTLLSDS